MPKLLSRKTTNFYFLFNLSFLQQEERRAPDLTKNSNEREWRVESGERESKKTKAAPN